MERAQMDIDDLLIPKDHDIPYEEAVVQNPYSVKTWLSYLDFKLDSPAISRNLIYERALREVPGSYKIWIKYLRDRRAQLKGKRPGDPAYEAVNKTFEKCLVYLHRMPRIWMEYTDFLASQKKITKTRQAFDRALRALSFGQHERIWRLYIKFVKTPEVPVQTAIRVFKRYLKFDSSKNEDFIEFLNTAESWDECSQQLVRLLNNAEEFRSSVGKSRHDYWIQLCDVISKHSDEVKNIKVDNILRGGITKFSDQVGRLWTALADYYIRLGHFEKARDVFEEGMDSVITVRDFTQIWDAYAKFEDGLLAAQMDTIESADNEEDDFELRAARYEDLIERQPLLVNSVLLRQNPHNVHEWLKRAELYRTDSTMANETFETALTTVDPVKAKGKPHTLWVAYARYHESRGNLEMARKTFDRGTKGNFRYVDDLASVWMEWAEMELRHGFYDKARSVLEQATVSGRVNRGFTGEDIPADSVQRKLHRSTRLWSFYADLEENLGTFQTTKAVYDKMFDLRVVTPQIVINYAQYLEENRYYEESFKSYEKGIAIFQFPHVFDVWVAYLQKFVSRYGSKKLERARELFEQILASVPAKDSKIFFVLYAELEERHGLVRHAMSIYDRATRAVAEQDRFAIFSLYINRATEYFGATKTREIYEKAIESLSEKQAKDMCLRFAELEKKLGEIDRARGVFVYGSQFCDPRLDPAYWQRWREFEVEFGNEDTFREMLRIKRSVTAQFNTQLNITSIEALIAINKVANGEGTLEKLEAANEMEKIEKQPDVARPVKFNPKAAEAAKASANPEQIELDDEDEEEPEEEDAFELEEKKMPQAVLDRNVVSKTGDQAGDGGKKMGALERMKRKAME